MRDEIRKKHEEREEILKLAREMFPKKFVAYENKKAIVRRKLKLPKKKSDFTAEQRRVWNEYLLKSRKKLEEYLIQRVKRECKGARAPVESCRDQGMSKEELRSKVLEAKLRKEEHRRELEERRALIKEKYGFTLGKRPVTPEEVEGRRRYDRDMEAAAREKHRERIRVYNRDYRRKKRAEALAVEQEKWTGEQWAEYRKKMAKKECPEGSSQWLVQEVVRYLARVQDISEDAVTARLIDLDGMDFLIKGAESIGRQRCANAGMVLAAVRALALYLDPDTAAMFAKRNEGGEPSRDERGT